MSTFSTASTLLSAIRTDLQESTAHKWLDATLLRLISRFHREVFTFLAAIPGSGFGTDTETFTIAASTESFDLSGLTQANGKFKAIHKLWHTPTGLDAVAMSPMAPELVERFRIAGTGTVNTAAIQTPGYLLQREGGTESLVVLPTASGTRTFKLQYVIETAELASDDSLQTPISCDFLIEALVTRKALVQKGMRNDDLEGEIDRGWQQLMNEFGGSSERSRGALGGSVAMEAMFGAYD